MTKVKDESRHGKTQSDFPFGLGDVSIGSRSRSSRTQNAHLSQPVLPLRCRRGCRGRRLIRQSGSVDGRTVPVPVVASGAQTTTVAAAESHDEQPVFATAAIRVTHSAPAQHSFHFRSCFADQNGHLGGISVAHSSVRRRPRFGPVFRIDCRSLPKLPQ